MKIVVLDGYAANPGDLSWSEVEAMGVCVVYDRTSPAELMERAKDAEVLLTNKTVLDAAAIHALPALRYIGVLATGYNIVDIDAARQRGIVVTNIPAYSTDSVAQMVFAHLLNISLRVGHHAEAVRQGRWAACKDFCFCDYRKGHQRIFPQIIQLMPFLCRVEIQHVFDYHIIHWNRIWLPAAVCCCKCAPYPGLQYFPCLTV